MITYRERITTFLFSRSHFRLRKKCCKNTTKNSHVPFTQIPPLLTFPTCVFHSLCLFIGSIFSEQFQKKLQTLCPKHPLIPCYAFPKSKDMLGHNHSANTDTLLPSNPQKSIKFYHLSQWYHLWVSNPVEDYVLHFFVRSLWSPLIWTNSSAFPCPACRWHLQSTAGYFVACCQFDFVWYFLLINVRSCSLGRATAQ